MSTFGFEAASRIIDSREREALGLPFVAAACSTLAAMAHAWVVRSHLTHWWLYGTFFAALGITQVAYAVLVARRPGRRVAVAGIVMNLGVLVLYAGSRIVGVPVGPHAGVRETVGAPDLLAAAAEIGLILALLAITRAGGARPGKRAGRWSIAVVMLALVGAAAAGPVGHAHPRLPAVTLSSGPVTWVGPPSPPPVAIPSPVAEEPTAEPSIDPLPEEPPPCGAMAAPGVSVPSPAPPGEAKAVVYSLESEIWVYDPQEGSAKKLTANGPNCWSHSPSFRTGSYISFQMENAVVGLDLNDGTIDELLSTKWGIMATAWSPDGKTLAYLTYGSDDQGGPQLALYRPASGTKEVVRTFLPSPGRCGSEDDESSISWAPDGHALIVTITHTEDESKTMWVVDPTGKDLVEARAGTHAAWGPDSKRIYYRDFMGDRKWRALNSETGALGTLGAMKPGTHGLAVSPDGTLLAYADGESDVGIYIYDVNQKVQRRIASDAVAPVWIGPRKIMVTDTDSCGDECFHSAWIAAGTMSVVDVVSEERDAVGAGTTIDADALLEEPAASPAPQPAPTTSPTAVPSPTGSPIPVPSPTEAAPSPTPTPTT